MIGGRRSLIAIVLLALLPAGPARSHGSGGHGHAGTAPPPADSGYAAPRPGDLGGPFEMVDHTGRAVSDRDLRGGWLALFFGFTGCREACPVGLANIAAAMDMLGPDAERLRPVFVDFSMEAPDLKGLAQFVSNFHPRLLGMTGTRKQIFNMLRLYKVRRDFVHSVRSAKETGPRIDHTTYVYLIDPEGRTAAYFYHSLPPDEMAAVIRRHMAAQ
jgi:protein SCO1/2